MSNISNSSIVIESDISEKAKVFNHAEIKKSKILEGASIGDYAMIVESTINRYASINRRNYIFKSTLGEFTYTGLNTMIISTNIGKYCSLSWNISIGGGNHDYKNVTSYPHWRFNTMMKGIVNHNDNKFIKKRLMKIGTTEIGNDVWIGTGAIIFRGVKIGHGAIIGAGAVVTKDVEPYAIITGVPGREIKRRFSDEQIKRLLKIEWWYWPNSLIEEHSEIIFTNQVNDDVLSKMEAISKQLLIGTE